MAETGTRSTTRATTRATTDATAATTRATTTAGGKRERTYGQFCPIATGLDIVGDRWVLLICRELAMGDQRFTDLRTALGRVAPNLLSERLRSLQDAGLVVTAVLPPPAARTVYRLTPAGRRVVPILRAVARFGAPYLDGAPGPDFGARRAAYSLLAPWWRPAPHASGEPSPSRYRLDVGEGDVVDLVADGTRLSVVPADASHDADVVVTTTVDGLVGARQEDGALEAEVIGPVAAIAAFFAAFDLRPARA